MNNTEPKMNINPDAVAEIFEFDLVELALKEFYLAYQCLCPQEFWEKELQEIYINHTVKPVFRIPSDQDIRAWRHSGSQEFPEELYFKDAVDVRLIKHSRYSENADHQHAFFEVIYVFNGVCENVVDGEMLSMKTGDICIIPPKVTHAIAVNTDSSILNILIRTSTFTDTFMPMLKNADILADFFNEIVYGGNYKKYLLFHPGEDPMLNELVLEMYSEQYEEMPYYGNILNGMLITFWGKLLQRHKESVEYPKSYVEKYSEVPKILSYIKQHCVTTNLNHCAERYHFNPQYLSAMLKKHTGKSFTALLTEARMQKAAQLLKQSELSIQKLGEEVGYKDSSYFMKVFKKYFGTTPSDYRNQNLS